jgi:protocadherin-15
LIINVEDIDDQDPSFIYQGCLTYEGACINPEYSASIIPGTVQKSIDIKPEKIKAVDLDAIGTQIRYEFVSGTPINFNEYFSIDEKTAEISQVKLVDSSVTDRQFTIIIRAEEISEHQRFTTAKLIINVKPVDAFPPVIIASDVVGVIEENSPVGTKVMSLKNKPIKFTIRDEDYSTDIDLPMYSFELTTPLFAVKNGFLVVNDQKLLDRETSERLLFQLVAREIHGNAASSPVSVNISVLDVNDNKPELFDLQPVTIDAGSAKRSLTFAHAKDVDAGTNATITYSLVGSPKILKKFSIDRETGEIFAVGRLNADEKLSVTVRATDGGGLYSDTILVVNVTAGPNTKPPLFSENIYEVRVNESEKINTTILTVTAEDPETDRVTYSIQSGNDLRQFSIDSESGAITIIRQLDRETLTQYQMIIRAEDAGGLFATSSVHIKILDANDNAPEFDESTMPYLFSIDEGKLNAFVGQIHAVDKDEGRNSDVVYSIPTDLPFTINRMNGEIHTKERLSHKKRNEYEFMVRASDRGARPLSNEIRIKISVKEVPDIVPIFAKSQFDVKVPENVADTLVTRVEISNPESAVDATYVIKKSSSRDLFKIDAKTGEIRTTQGLDYEAKSTHELIVGTVENEGKSPGDVVKIKVIVEDRNDVAPVFLLVPDPVSVTDDQHVGSLITSIPAVDTDGTSPGNVVRYELIGKGKALKFFHIDPENGNIRIKEDLRNDPTTTQYEIEVRAYDLGEPQLSSVSSLVIFVKHIQVKGEGEVEKQQITKTDTEEQGLSFGDEIYVTNIPESTSVNATIKLIQVLNAKKTKNGFSCDIVGGNDFDIFAVVIEDQACAIKLLSSLDFEKRTTHELKIQLSSTKQRINQKRNFATLKILVQDFNDNAPIFKFKNTSMKRFKRNDTYYGVINYDATIGTNVLKVEAYDDDSGTFGLIKYRLLDDDSNVVSKDDLPSSYFIITDTGVIKNRKPLHKAIIEGGHFEFQVEAMDNFGKESGVVHKSTARVVINVLSDLNRLTLAFPEASPNEIKRHARSIEDILTDKSQGLIATVEKFSSRKTLMQNGSIVELPEATDTWFYVLDPVSEKILPRNSTMIMNNLLESNIQSQINIAVSKLVRSPSDGIFGPVEAENEIHHLEVSNTENLDNNSVRYSIISVSVVVGIIVIVALIYVFVWWSR